MVNRLTFYNNFHKGDIHYSRQFIKDIMSKITANEYYYEHNYDNNILKDITNLNISKITNLSSNIKDQVILDNNNGYINTWIGQNNFIYLKHNCSLYSNYDMYKDIYSKLNINIENIEYYIPSIDFNHIEKSNIDLFINNNKEKIKIFISNGDVLSGQSLNFDFNLLINYLSDLYTDVIFILTDSKNRIIKGNVFYTDDIIQMSSDLNEISYLSKNCDIIIGRASGPFCFTHIQENLLDSNKVYIGISNTENESNWFKSGVCKQLWTNNYDINNILNIINNEIILKINK